MYLRAAAAAAAVLASRGRPGRDHRRAGRGRARARHDRVRVPRLRREAVQPAAGGDAARAAHAGIAAGQGSWVSHFLRSVVDESNRRRPGGEAVLERMSEMLFVEVLRRYVDDPAAGTDGLARGHARPGRRPRAGAAARAARRGVDARAARRGGGALALGAARAVRRTSSASRRCSTWRSGACSSPRRACATPTPRSSRSRSTSATRARRRSRARSAALVGVAPGAWRRSRRTPAEVVSAEGRAGGTGGPGPGDHGERAARMKREPERAAMDILDAIGNTSIVRASQGRPDRLRGHLREARVGESDREHEGPDGAGDDRAGGSRRPAEARRHRRSNTPAAAPAPRWRWSCAAKGYRIQIVTSDAFSREKRDHMAALGAELTLVPSEGGLTTRKLILRHDRGRARDQPRPHTYWTDQLDNHDSIAGYHPLGEEIWSQTNGRIDAFVHCVGTAASCVGVATRAEAAQPGIRVVAVEPAESSVLLGRPGGPAQDRGRRDRLRASALGADARRRDPRRADRGRQGHGSAPRAGGGAVRGDLLRGECRRGDPGGGASRAWCPGRHADGRLRAEVPEHGRVPEAGSV